jgi:filamentous hemagglutinin family protein
MKLQHLLIITLLINSLYANAEVTLDGTLGRGGALPGSDYLIGADLGQQVGGNLFHSFRDFNLNSHESATFSGPNSVTNILSRVTGGNPSQIDGLIRSTIPNADMYFLNPYGIIFGSNARLDVQGSFHASTADYISLKDGGRFDARHPSHSLLTIAPIEAFGFVKSKVAPISVQGYGKVTPDWKNKATGLSVPSSKTLSLIGGQIEIWMGTFFNMETFDYEGYELTEIIPLPTLSAPYGRINLASIAGIGEIKLGRDFVDVSDIQLADIHITKNSLLSTSGEGGGSIFVRGGQIFADNSAIEAITLGSHDGGAIDLRANTISLNGTTLNGSTVGIGKGSDIFLRATDFITVAGENDDFNSSAIYARSGIPQELMDNNLGDAGKISLEAKNISFQDGAEISVSTYGGGKGGDVTLKASESVSFSGEKISGGTGFFAVSTFSNSSGAGDAGQLSIEAEKILFTEGNSIDSKTEGAGKGGNVTLKASERIEVSGENSEGIGTQINMTTSSTQKNAGDAGTLLIEADQIYIKEGAAIISYTDGKGNAGTVMLNADNKLELTGVNSEGAGSQIEVATFGTGNAGDIIVRAKDISLTDGALLLSASFAPGKAGNVRVHATGIVTIAGANQQGLSSVIGSDSNPKTEGLDSNIKTEGLIGGEGGNITIEANQLIIKDGGQIGANSVAPKGVKSSRGGTITIRVQGAVEISGVNPYGENEDGFGSGIYARSIGVEDNAGEGGQITLQSGALIIKEGGVIISSTNNNAQGGNIEIDVRGTVKMTGDASHIPLKEPADSQLNYLQGFSPTQYNQSTSGIYARSEGKNEQAGQGGIITLHANELIITNNSKIATSSAGGGKAGNIRIEVNQLQMDNTAAIASESQLSNTYIFANTAERDSRLLVLGDVVEVTDVGDGRSARYINTGNNLIRTTPVYTVADMTELQELSYQYSLVEGDIVEVIETEHGESARFIYAYHRDYQLEAWVKIDNNVTATFQDIEQLNEIHGQWYTPDEQLPYDLGKTIKVTDAENGKSTTFIYTTVLDPLNGYTQGRTVKLNNFAVTDTVALQTLTENTAIVEGAVAELRNAGYGTNSRFTYKNNAWIAFNDIRTVSDIAEMNALAVAQTGYIAEIANAGDGKSAHLIYSGKEWLPLNNNNHAEHQIVSNLSELEKRPSKQGDIVDVVNASMDQYEHFFYVDGQWKKQIRGGEAGTITINARDGIFLSNDSTITTEAISAGGGGMKIKTDKSVRLTNSKISTSVKESTGAGGDIALNSEFVILENGKIIARAYEGQGGNMNITTTSIYKFPPTSKSTVDASSQLGVDGVVTINSPDENADEEMLALSSSTFDASRIIEKPCQAMSLKEYTNRSSFDVFSLAGSSSSPYDLKPSRLSQQSVNSANSVDRMADIQPYNTNKTTERRRQVSLLTTCRKKVNQLNTEAADHRRSSVIPEEPLF